MKRIYIKVLIIFILIFINVYVVISFNSNNKGREENEYGIDRDEIFTTNFPGGKEVFAKDKEVDGLLFQHLSYVYNPNTNMGNISIAITNTNDVVYKLDGFQVIIRDKNNKKIMTIDIDFRVDIDKYTTIMKDFEVSGDELGPIIFEMDYKPKKIKD